MGDLLSGVLPLLPLFPLVAGGWAWRASGGTAGRRINLGVQGAVLVAFILALGLIFSGPLNVVYAIGGSPSVVALSLRLDLVTAVMGLLVASLGAVIVRFSRGYLAGDPRQARFLSWMCLTLSSVLMLIIAGNLQLILAAWVATSLSLHRLLLFYPDRPGAVFAARKKFVASRLGDLCLLVAVIIVFRHYGTGELESLFQAAARGDTQPLPRVGLLLAACAALKSAQFPFHSWLPDTMETPTPVSAFMHAGIINAGGFLVIRLSPLFAHAPSAMALLALLGSLTAAFGAVVMLAQPSVKRALAYSTIAQMGFMLLQCGLGAFGLALLHLVAHSLYKAYAFLHAGSTIGSRSKAAIRLQVPALALGVLVSGLMVALSTTLLTVLFPEKPPGAGLFSVVLTLSIAYGLARLWSAGGGWGSALRGTAVAIGIAGVSFGLHGAATRLMFPFPAVTSPLALRVFVGAVFVGLFLFQALLWRSGHYPLGRVLYVHALNGFYVGTWANRLLGRLWPRHTTD
jgi:NAD(P)H-quinone oxidoreductase subunit 5